MAEITIYNFLYVMNCKFFSDKKGKYFILYELWHLFCV